MIHLFEQDFVGYAFLCGSLIAILAAIVGYFVVLRGQAFAAHLLAVVGFPGWIGAVLLGISGLIGVVGATLGTGLLVAVLEERIAKRDVDIGMILAFVLGLGVLFMHIHSGDANQAANILFGSILSVTTQDVMVVVVLGLVALAALAALAVLFRPLLFVSVDPEMARARGVPVRLIGVAFLLVLAITVAEAAQVVGILLIFALLIAPPAIARHVLRRPLAVIALAIGLGLAFTWGGLILAVLTPYPVSFYITALAGSSYLIVVNLSHKLRPHAFHEPAHPDREFVDHPGHQHAHPHHHHHHH
ncbi:MAG: metal ABC transporter permease [Planctomycetota bacterium]